MYPEKKHVLIITPESCFQPNVIKILAIQHCITKLKIWVAMIYLYKTSDESFTSDFELISNRREPYFNIYHFSTIKHLSNALPEIKYFL